MTSYDHALAKATAIAGTIAAEVAMAQASTSVSEWMLRNAALLLAVGAGLIGYGKLHNRVEALRESVATKASNDTVNALDKKLDTIHDDVREVRQYLMGDK